MLQQALTVKELAAITRGEAKVDPKTQLKEITHIHYDSRKIYNDGVKKGVFFALKSDSNDGHDYISEAYQKGIRVFVVSHNSNIILKDAVIIKTRNTHYALQLLAKNYRKNLDCSIVAITGSNGKTIVKEWLYQMLWDKMLVGRSPRSFNSQIGVPISVLGIPRNTDLAIIEAGISKAGEMKKLEAIILPKIGVLTNFGEAHRSGFLDKTEHLLEKLSLFKHCKKIVLPNDPFLRNIIKVNKLFKGKKLFWFGYENKSDVFCDRLSLSDHETTLNIVISENKKVDFTIPFTDKASADNFLCVLTILYVLGFSLEEFSKKANGLSSVEMRLEIKKGINNSTIINDTFNADITSLKTALETLAVQKGNEKWVLLTDFLQSQTPNDKLYKEIANSVNKTAVHKVILLGENIIKYKHFFKNVHYCTNQREKLFSKSVLLLNKGDIILLKGARKYKLEEVSSYLEEFNHDTVLEVNLNALLNNVNYFRSKLNKKTMLMCMVKAFSYGVGDAEIALALQDHKVDYLGVAYADEGVSLRKAGVRLPIMVMNPEISSYDSVIDYNLEPEIYSFRVLEKFIEKLKAKGISAPYPIHIKVNSGMNRLGFKKEDAKVLAKIIKNNSYVNVLSIFSHLAAADNLKEDNFTRSQFVMFDDFYQFFVKELDYKVIRHILNTSAIVNYPEYQMEMVRLGIGMYGHVSASKASNNSLENMASLRTVISQIHHIKKGDTTGYTRGFIANKKMKIAVLPLGYADGIDRRLGNGNLVVGLKDGENAPTVGNICMDMMMLDISHLDNIKEGDRVTIFNTNAQVLQIAKKLDTIPYEVLTGLSERLKRIYVKE